MSAKYMDMETLRFQLYEIFNMKEILDTERYEDYDPEMIDMLLDSVKTFADQKLYPVFREMDEDPARYEDGMVHVHEAVRDLFKTGGELGLLGSFFPKEHGGMQMPYLAYIASYFIMDAANNHLPGYLDLTTGSAHLIESFGTPELRDYYLPKMCSGEWAGTMCLTEPQAGSSLSDVQTSATPNGDGSYSIQGQKIFISGGEHDKTDNIVHLVLARIDGAPAGTKGISLFVVPKLREEDGQFVPNDVICAGDYQKMGQRGWCTTHLVFGEEQNSKGWLVGNENEGLKNMFLMMNEARMTVGRIGASCTTAAYYAALQYANERPQGRPISRDGRKDVNQEQTLIINHADVRRMLLLQKSVAEGSLALVLQGAEYQERYLTSTDEDEKFKYKMLIELMTPVIKTYPAEMGFTATNNGLQVLGGYGFCSEYVLQQYLRDMRILSLYEGTTGIQSIDLLGRKTTMKNGAALQFIMAEIQETIKGASTYDELKPYAKSLGESLQLTQKVLTQIMPYAMEGNYERFLSDATIYMEFVSKILVGWQWLKMATKAKEALVTGNMVQDAKFYESKIHTLKYYYKYEMSRTKGIAEIIMSEETPTIKHEDIAEAIM